MSDLSVSVSIEDLDAYEDGLGSAFILGFTQALLMSDDTETCDTCTCWRGDDVNTTPETAPAALDFKTTVRDYLERYDLVDEDDLVTKVEVTPREVTAHVRE